MVCAQTSTIQETRTVPLAFQSLETVVSHTHAHLLTNLVLDKRVSQATAETKAFAAQTIYAQKDTLGTTLMKEILPRSSADPFQGCSS